MKLAFSLQERKSFLNKNTLDKW